MLNGSNLIQNTSMVLVFELYWIQVEKQHRSFSRITRSLFIINFRQQFIRLKNTCSNSTVHQLSKVVSILPVKINLFLACLNSYIFCFLITAVFLVEIVILFTCNEKLYMFLDSCTLTLALNSSQLRIVKEFLTLANTHQRSNCIRCVIISFPKVRIGGKSFKLR